MRLEGTCAHAYNTVSDTRAGMGKHCMFHDQRRPLPDTAAAQPMVYCVCD